MTPVRGRDPSRRGAPRPPGAADARFRSAKGWCRPASAPSTFRRSSVPLRGFPAFENRRLPVRADRPRALDPGTELWLRKLRVLLLQLDPVRVPRLEVL